MSHHSHHSQESRKVVDNINSQLRKTGNSAVKNPQLVKNVEFQRHGGKSGKGGNDNKNDNNDDRHYGHHSHEHKHGHSHGNSNNVSDPNNHVCNHKGNSNSQKNENSDNDDNDDIDDNGHNSNIKSNRGKTVSFSIVAEKKTDKDDKANKNKIDKQSVSQVPHTVVVEGLQLQPLPPLQLSNDNNSKNNHHSAMILPMPSVPSTPLAPLGILSSHFNIEYIENGIKITYQGREYIIPFGVNGTNSTNGAYGALPIISEIKKANDLKDQKDSKEYFIYGNNFVRGAKLVWLTDIFDLDVVSKNRAIFKVPSVWQSGKYSVKISNPDWEESSPHIFDYIC